MKIFNKYLPWMILIVSLILGTICTFVSKFVGFSMAVVVTIVLTYCITVYNDSVDIGSNN